MQPETPQENTQPQPINPQPQVVPPAPQPPVPPVVPQPPVMPPVGTVPPVSQPVMGQVAMPPAKKSHKKLFIGLGLGTLLLVLLIVAFIVYVLFFGEAAAARKASNNFMSNITAANTEGAYALISHTGEKESDIKFLTGAAADSKGDYKLTSYKIVAETGKKTTGYFLYDLTNDTNKHARVTVEKVDGEWIVVGYVYGKNPLVLVPAAKTDTTTTTPKETTTTETKATASTCLVDADVAPLTGGEAFGTDFTTEGYRKYIVDTYFFKADSTNYAYPDQAKTQLDKIGTFYTTNAGKTFTIYLQGMAKDSAPTSSGIKLANQRAEKIKAELMSRGVTADRFVIDTPKSSASYSDGTERNVDLTIRVKIPCS